MYLKYTEFVEDKTQTKLAKKLDFNKLIKNAKSKPLNKWCTSKCRIHYHHNVARR